MLSVNLKSTSLLNTPSRLSITSLFINSGPCDHILSSGSFNKVLLRRLHNLYRRWWQWKRLSNTTCWTPQLRNSFLISSRAWSNWWLLNFSISFLPICMKTVWRLCQTSPASTCVTSATTRRLLILLSHVLHREMVDHCVDYHFASVHIDIILKPEVRKAKEINSTIDTLKTNANKLIIPHFSCLNGSFHFIIIK
jgi:hypothetical protein